MEMWFLGSGISEIRLALFLFLSIPLLIGLSHYIGFEDTLSLKDDTLDAFVAYAVAFVASSVVLVLFAVIESGMSIDEMVGKVAIQAVPGSIGAMLAQSQFGKKKRRTQTGANDMAMSCSSWLSGHSSSRSTWRRRRKCC